MAFVAAAAMGMELMEVIGGGAAVAEAAADVAAAAEAIAMEEAIPLMETAVGRTVSGTATRSFAAYSSAARAGSIARALGASGLISTAVTGAVAARSFKKAEEKVSKLLGLGKRKRDGTSGTASLLPAHPTRPALPVMPRKKAKNSKKRAKTRISKRTQKKSAKRKDSKKTKPKKKGPSRTRVNVYQTHGLIQRDHVSYFGFQNHGGRKELFMAVADGVLRTLFRKFRIQIRNPDEPVFPTAGTNGVDLIRIQCRKKRFDTGEDPASVTEITIDLTPSVFTTYQGIVESFANDLRSAANSGQYPRAMFAYNSSGVNNANGEVMRDLMFGDAIVSVAVNTAIKLRNITPNDGNGTDRFALDTNPLEGVLYKFTGDAPVPVDSFYESNPTLVARFMDGDVKRGLQFGPQRASAGDHTGDPDAASGIMGDDKVLSHPPKNGRTIWTNCRSSTRVAMAPGASVVHKMKYTYTGKLTKFMQSFSNEQDRPGNGVCHWLGLEQKFRQKLKAASGQHTASEHDHVVVEYDIDRTVSAGCSFAAAAKGPRAVLTDVLNSAPTT